jgi:hypothetical protein
MRIFFYALLISIAASGTCFAGSSFLDFLNNPGVTQQPQQQGIVCPGCGFNNQAGAAYCAGCGRSLQSGNALYVNCPHCGKRNVIQVKYCSSCGAENAVQNSYCAKCGTGIAASEYWANCQYCGRKFSFTTGNEYESVRCKRCHKYYSSSYDECPYCAEEYNDDHERRDKHTKHNDDQEDDGKRKHRDSDQPSGMVLVDQFTKNGGGQEGKKYNISGSTGNRAFSKVIVECNIKSGGISINTIYVRCGSQDYSHPIAARLQNGKNEFSIDIPQGSSFLTISFQSSGNTDIKVYMK